MLPSFSRGLRLALVLALSAGYIGWQGHAHSAYAAKKGADDSDSDGDEDSNGDEDSDKGDKGGDDTDEDNPDDKDQPPVTAGGLFTLATYPQSELLRPLTMTQKLTQVRLGIGTDISAKGAFATAGVSLEAIHGVTDNFSLIGGFTNAYNMRQFSAYFGFEGSLVYDLLDIRLAANLHRNALARYSNFCSPVTATDQANPTDTAQCGATTQASIVNLPNGDYNAGGTKFSIDLGFPLRYNFVPQFAVVALQTLISIDFNSVDRDHVIADPQSVTVNGTQTTINRFVPVGNGAKPDLNPSIGLEANPIPQLSLTIFAQLRVPDFDTAAGAFQVPVTARIEASPTQKLDVGLEFTLLNVMPPEGQSPIDNRFISLFVQSRFGR
ncbi:MAG TPA: hypothetical protein VFP84_22535 [Kofleriaceae bacterium]|nr:hypothetical protein [Kofleriaceae bacterium]